MTARPCLGWLKFGMLVPVLLVLISACSHRNSPVVAPLTPLQRSEAAVHTHPDDLSARRTLAQQFLEAGERYAAVEQIEVARQLSPGDESLALWAARIYRDLGEFELAAEVLRPGNRASNELLLAYSQALLTLGDFQGAATAAGRLRSQWKALPEATRQYVARAFLLAGDAEEADRLIPADATDPDWLALRGLSQLVEGDSKSSTTTLANAVAANPGDAWNQYLLGKARLDAGDAKQGLAAWLTASRAPNPPAPALIGAAGLLARAGKPNDAEALLARVDADDQRSPAYWEARAEIAVARGEPVKGGIARGYAAYNSGDPWQAEDLWKSAIHYARGADLREIYAALYNSAYQRQDAEPALRYTRDAVLTWPDDPYFLMRRAGILLGQNQLKEAQVVAEKLQKVAPQDQAAAVAELLCRIALDSSQPDLLERNARIDRTLRPDDPLPLLHLAEWQGRQGGDTANLERTLKLYREAIAVAPRDPESHARAGILLAELKRPSEAVTELLHALGLYPSVLESAPMGQLVQIYQRLGWDREKRFEEKQYQWLRKLKDDWPIQLKTMRKESAVSEWKALGETALNRHETWIALCAFERTVRLSPKDPDAWRLLAAALKRLGRFDEALAAMRRATLLQRVAPTRHPGS